jgi:threonine dehydratase
MPASHEPLPLETIRAARARIAPDALRTPLVRLETEGGAELHLKLENLQPIGSFKLRGASNALRSVDPSLLAHGVWTASAGNMGQGIAWVARRLGIPCAVVIPDSAPAVKREAMERLGAVIHAVPFATWIEVFRTGVYDGVDGHFVHPFSDPRVMAGNGTIGLELLEDLPDAEAVVVPYGGGGLSCGIASAVKALSPDCRVFACEVETAAPLAASLAAGTPTEVAYAPSFVDGIGAPVVFPEMFALARRVLDGSIVVGLEEVARAVRVLLEQAHVVAEGAGAAAVAAAARGDAGGGKIVCVVSGGNLEPSTLVEIAAGRTPV